MPGIRWRVGVVLLTAFLALTACARHEAVPVDPVLAEARHTLAAAQAAGAPVEAADTWGTAVLQLEGAEEALQRNRTRLALRRAERARLNAEMALLITELAGLEQARRDLQAEIMSVRGQLEAVE